MNDISNLPRQSYLPTHISDQNMEHGSTSNPPPSRPPPLLVCPSSLESVTFPTHWYRLPDDDKFLICTKCYQDKLHSTRFASLLRCDNLDFGPGMVATCDFNTPRIDALLRHAVASNDLQPLASLAKRRLHIEDCAGTQGIKGGSQVKWFKPVNDAIPNFVCCEACYEDVVLSTDFRLNFVPSWRQQPTDQTWSCDLALPYLKQILQMCARRGDWHGFVQTSVHRMSLPECVDDSSVIASAKRWYNTVRPSPIRDLTICEVCYLDRAGWQQDVAQCFAPIAFGPNDVNLRLICDFQLLPMAACSDILFAQNMYEKWHYFAGLTSSKPRCDKEGIVDGEWYGLPNPNDASRTIENFDICAACHAGWNQSADWGHLFRRLNYPPGTSRVCDFNPSGPRQSRYIRKWNQMYLTRNPSPFVDYVSRLASLPLCQGSRSLENAAWYGDKDAALLACPACFEEVVRGSHFASTFPLQNIVLPAEHHCSLYSSRMRAKYAEACHKKSLASLLSFAAHREQIFQQTVPQIAAFQADQRQKMEMLKVAHHQRAIATQTTSIGRAFMGGNPIVSNFDPAVRMLHLGYEQQRRNLQFDPRKPAMMELEAKWKEVE